MPPGLRREALALRHACHHPARRPARGHARPLPAPLRCSRSVETLSFSNEGGRYWFHDHKWQNCKKLSKTRYFDCSDVVNCSPNHLEFSLGRPMFGCRNWSKIYHEFEKFVQLVPISRFKRVSNDGCKLTKSFCYVH